jgi:hypothetical protein
MGTRIFLLRLKREEPGAPLWDQRSEDGRIGATTSIVVPWLVDRLYKGVTCRRWRGGSKTICPTANSSFFPKLAAFNIN